MCASRKLKQSWRYSKQNEGIGLVAIQICTFLVTVRKFCCARQILCKDAPVDNIIYAITINYFGTSVFWQATFPSLSELLFPYMVRFWCDFDAISQANKSCLKSRKLANFASLQQLKFKSWGSKFFVWEMDLKQYISYLATLPICGFLHAWWILHKLKKSGSWQSKCTLADGIPAGLFK